MPRQPVRVHRKRDIGGQAQPVYNAGVAGLTLGPRHHVPSIRGLLKPVHASGTKSETHDRPH